MELCMHSRSVPCVRTRIALVKPMDIPRIVVWPPLRPARKPASKKSDSRGRGGRGRGRGRSRGAGRARGKGAARGSGVALAVLALEDGPVDHMSGDDGDSGVIGAGGKHDGADGHGDPAHEDFRSPHASDAEDGAPELGEP